MIKRLLVVYLFCMGLSAPAGADYESAMAAYRRGDFDTAAKELHRLAERGMVRAQSVLALMYEYGEGVEQNPVEAARWYRRAAAGGHVGAQFIVAGLYASGTGVPHDDAEALRWYRRAAQQGHARAQYDLARMLEEGRGTQQDLAAARRWYEAAAAQGNRDAAARLESPVQNPRLRANPAPPVSAPPPTDGQHEVSVSTARGSTRTFDPAPAPEAFRVQLAAFRSLERASEAWSTLRGEHPDLLGRLEHHIERVELGGAGGVWHRLQAGPLPSEAAAEHLCRQLERRGAARGCFASRIGAR